MRWFDSAADFRQFEDSLVDAAVAAQALADRDTVPGRCLACERDASFIVTTGARFEERPNLREGLLCSRCRLTARQRTLLLAVRETLGRNAAGGGAVLERFSRLYRMLRREYPNMTGSEFLSPRHESGRRYLWHPPGRWWRAAPVRHESITALSYRDESLDFVIHTDVLEHVPDTRMALRECRRVLKRERPVVFTVPFFTTQARNTIRGRLDEEGNLIELLPTELHGDGLNSRGIYTFYNFGWEFFEQLKEVFGRTQIGAIHAPEHGFVYADAKPGPWNMLPIVFRAYR
ncbi:hypothetical protein GCM10027431_21300 [Lysobacter rhizosphaerae]